MTSPAAWLRLCRAPNTLTAAADVYAGAALAGADFRSPALHVVAAGSALIYAGGVALNDVADAEKDRELHPDRPIPSGAIGRRAAALVGGVLLAIGTATSFVSEGPGLVVGLFVAAAVLVYDFGRSSWVGPVAMAAARGGNLLRGAALVGPLASPAVDAATHHVFLIFALTVISQFEDAPVERRHRHFKLFTLALAIGYLGPLRVAGASEHLVSGIGAGIIGLAVFCFVARPFGKPPPPGLVVFRAVFTLSLVDAAYVFGTGKLIPAMLVACVVPVSFWIRGLIAQRGS